MTTKQQLCERIWEPLQPQGVARFPGAVGRIPNFEGAREAAELACRLQVWQPASVLKCIAPRTVKADVPRFSRQVRGVNDSH